jgi:hypothetical protein
MLVCATEMTRRAEMDALDQALRAPAAVEREELA